MIHEVGIFGANCDSWALDKVFPILALTYLADSSIRDKVDFGEWRNSQLTKRKFPKYIYYGIY
jgi:hypothetical protein